MMPQGSFKRLSQMTDSEQKSILENALHLGILSVVKTKVQTEINDLQNAIHDTEASLRLFNSEFQKSQNTLNTLASEKNEIYKRNLHDKALQLSAFLKEVIEYERYILENKPPLDISDAQNTLKKIKQLEEKLQETWDFKLSEIVDKITEQKLDTDRLITENNNLQKDINLIKKQEPGSKCPLCFQEITAKHVNGCIKDLTKKMEKLVPKISNETEKLKELQDQQDILRVNRQKSMQKAKESQEAAQIRVTEAVQSNESYRYRTEFIKRFEEHLENRIVKPIKDESEVLLNLTQIEINKIHEIEIQIEQATKDLNIYKEKMEYLLFWEQGFSNSGLKSKILASVTPYLNLKAEQYLRNLTNRDLSVVFNTQVKLKSGSMREKFSIEINNKHGADTYAGNSEGEKSRADLAINFTISDLVASRSKKSYPQRFFDEPFENLDEAGIETVMNMLLSMSKTCGTIFVITHQSGFKSLFNKAITVSKNNGISLFDEGII
jgi:DNA repair exonuclease SbcCD ATPase subunit